MMQLRRDKEQKLCCGACQPGEHKNDNEPGAYFYINLPTQEMRINYATAYFESLVFIKILHAEYSQCVSILFSDT